MLYFSWKIKRWGGRCREAFTENVSFELWSVGDNSASALSKAFQAEGAAHKKAEVCTWWVWCSQAALEGSYPAWGRTLTPLAWEKTANMTLMQFFLSSQTNKFLEKGKFERSPMSSTLSFSVPLGGGREVWAPVTSLHSDPSLSLVPFRAGSVK